MYILTLTKKRDKHVLKKCWIKCAPLSHAFIRMRHGGTARVQVFQSTANIYCAADLKSPGAIQPAESISKSVRQAAVAEPSMEHRHALP